MTDKIVIIDKGKRLTAKEVQEAIQKVIAESLTAVTGRID